MFKINGFEVFGEVDLDDTYRARLTLTMPKKDAFFSEQGECIIQVNLEKSIPGVGWVEALLPKIRWSNTQASSEEGVFDLLREELKKELAEEAKARRFALRILEGLRSAKQKLIGTGGILIPDLFPSGIPLGDIRLTEAFSNTQGKPVTHELLIDTARKILASYLYRDVSEIVPGLSLSEGGPYRYPDASYIIDRLPRITAISCICSSFGIAEPQPDEIETVEDLYTLIEAHLSEITSISRS